MSERPQRRPEATGQPSYTTPSLSVTWRRTTPAPAYVALWRRIFADLAQHEDRPHASVEVDDA